MYFFFALFLSFVIFSNGGDVVELFAEEHGSVIFECSNEPTKKCLVMHNSEKQADRVSDIEISRFKILNSSDGDICVIEFINLTIADSGIYSCHVDNNETNFELDVEEKPVDSLLRYNTKPVLNNSVLALIKTSSNFATFLCEVDSKSKKTTLTWYVNDREESAIEIGHKSPDDENDKLKSTLYLNITRFDNNAELNVKCAVEYLAPKIPVTKTLQVIIGKAYETQNVTLKYVSNSKKEVICEANGIPRPNDFKIEKLLVRNNWTEISTDFIANITEAGVYMCRARYGSLADYVESNKLEHAKDAEDAVQKSGMMGVGTILAVLFGVLAVLIIIAVFMICCRIQKKKNASL